MRISLYHETHKENVQFGPSRRLKILRTESEKKVLTDFLVLSSVDSGSGSLTLAHSVALSKHIRYVYNSNNYYKLSFAYAVVYEKTTAVVKWAHKKAA